MREAIKIKGLKAIVEKKDHKAPSLSYMKKGWKAT